MASIQFDSGLFIYYVIIHGHAILVLVATILMSDSMISWLYATQLDMTSYIDLALQCPRMTEGMTPPPAPEHAMTTT